MKDTEIARKAQESFGTAARTDYLGLQAPKHKQHAHFELACTLQSFRGSGYLEISDDVDIGSRIGIEWLSRGGSPFTKSNIRVIYHLAVANAREGVREAICAP